MICGVRSLGNYAGTWDDRRRFRLEINRLKERGAAGLRSFQVYRHNSVAVYREAITRRDCDGLSDTRAMVLRAVPAKQKRSRRDQRRSGQGECAVNKLKQLETCGQSPWLDYLKRSLIEKGELRTLIERDGLKGVTSESFDLREGDRRDRRVCRSPETVPRARGPQHLGNLRASGDRRHPCRGRRPAPRPRTDAGARRLHQPGMLALPGQRHRSYGG